MNQDDGWTTVSKKGEKIMNCSTRREPLASRDIPNSLGMKSMTIESQEKKTQINNTKAEVPQRHHGGQVSGIVKRRDEWQDHCLIDLEDGLEDVFCHRHRCQNKILPPAGIRVHFKLHLSSKSRCWQSGLVSWQQSSFDHNQEKHERNNEDQADMNSKELDAFSSLPNNVTPENVPSMQYKVQRKNSDDGHSAVWPHHPPERTETPVVPNKTSEHVFLRNNNCRASLTSSIEDECLPRTRPRAGSAPVDNAPLWSNNTTEDHRHDHRHSSVETWAASVMDILDSRDEWQRPQTPEVPVGIFAQSTPPPKNNDALCFSAGPRLGHISPLVQEFAPEMPLYDGPADVRRGSPVLGGGTVVPYSATMSPLALLNAEQSREAEFPSSLTLTPGRPPRPPSAPPLAIQPPRSASVFSNATPPPPTSVTSTPSRGPLQGTTAALLAKSSPSLLHSEDRVRLKVVSVDEPRLPWLATARVPEAKAAPLALLAQSIDSAIEAGNASAILKLKRRRETRKRAKRGEHCRVELRVDDTNVHKKVFVVDAYAVNAAGAGAALRFMLRANAAAMVKATGSESERAELEALGWAELVAQLKLVLAPFEPEGICCNHLSRAFEKQFGSALVETLFGDFESLAALLRAPELRHVVHLKESPGKPDLAVSLSAPNGSSPSGFSNKPVTPVSLRRGNGTPTSAATPESLHRSSPSMWRSHSANSNTIFFDGSPNRPHLSPGLSPPGIGRRTQQLTSAPKLPTDFFRPISAASSGPSLGSSLNIDSAAAFKVVHPRLVDSTAVLSGVPPTPPHLSAPIPDMRSLSLGTTTTVPENGLRAPHF